MKTEGEAEVEEEGEEGVERQKEEEGDDEKGVTGGAEPASRLRFGIAVVGGKDRVVAREKIEEGGRGETGSWDAEEEGGTFWQTGADKTDEGGETGGSQVEHLAEMKET